MRRFTKPARMLRGSMESTGESDYRDLNARLRRIGVGASVRLAYRSPWDSLPARHAVVARDATPAWFSRDLREHERSHVLQRDPGTHLLLVGYEPWHGRPVPLLYREAREGVPVVDVEVTERGVQVDADRCAADLHGEVARYGGR